MDTTNTETMDPRIHALAKHLNCDISEVSKTSYGDNEYEAEGSEYLVLANDEADWLAAERIKDTLWAFNAEFISSHTERGLSDDQIKALKEMQGKLCESANCFVEALIKDLDHFIEDAIRSDGRGHFISSFDGDESEVGEFYIYRTN